MGAYAGPKINEDGLVLALDAANYKSFKGEATTNVITNTNLNTGWSQGYNTSIQWNDYPPPNNVDSQVVSFVDSDGNGAGYWYSYGDYAPQDPSTTYTVSVYARTIGSDWSIRAYTADNSETGRQYTNILTVPGDGEWHRLVFNSFTTPANTQSDSLSFNFTSITAGQRCWLCAPQMEAKSYATTFTTGTRGTTVATGGGWADLTGNGNNGQLVNGVRESADNLGSLVFDGTNDYVNAPLTKSASCTFSCWARTTTLAGNPMLFNAGPNASGPDLFFYNGKISWNIWDGDSNPLSTTPTSVTDGNYHHYVVVNDALSNTKLYYDGVLLGTATYRTAANNTNLTIGGNTSSYMWNGNISNFTIHNRALTDIEVRRNFRANLGRFGI